MAGRAVVQDANHPIVREAGHGRHATTPMAIPARGWKEVLWRVWGETNEDNMSIIAAGCAFYALLALFPAITALVAIYGLVADPSTVEAQMAQLQGVLPGGAYEIVQGQAHKVAAGGSTALSWGAALSLVLALYSASAGVKTLFTALNIAYEQKETRGFLRFQATALAVTLGMVVALIAGLAVIVGVPAVLAYVPLGPFAEGAVAVVPWLLLLGMITGGLAVLYRVGPARAAARWRWITPGSLVASALWLLTSLLFSVYAANFAGYNETYGALGGVIALLMWLWISTFVVLLGAELNAELELQTVEDTTTGPERPMGQRRAFAADHVAHTKDTGEREQR